MKNDAFPITDNHIHIDLKQGKGLEAVYEFERSGGTHMFLVSLPSRHLGFDIKSADDYKLLFDETLRVSNKINEETGVVSFPVLGIHPVEIIGLSEKYGIENAKEIICKGFDIASSYVVEKEAVALKTGRPHFETNQGIKNASNEIMSYVFSLAHEKKFPVQLHVEEMTENSLNDIARIAKNAKLSPEKIINHHATPLVKEAEKYGIYPSITCGKDMIETAIESGTRFLMETDYVDDPVRPGFVLGPKTVPKRTLKLVEKYEAEPFWKIHKEIPEKIYDVEIEIK
ncbi:MAG: metal-dependent hydrolase [Methanosarcinaceae archaeon]|nr:metal-dependent hydrolase [Methanosarcinaceae archaeon]